MDTPSKDFTFSRINTNNTREQKQQKQQHKNSERSLFDNMGTGTPVSIPTDKHHTLYKRDVIAPPQPASPSQIHALIREYTTSAHEHFYDLTINTTLNSIERVAPILFKWIRNRLETSYNSL